MSEHRVQHPDPGPAADPPRTGDEEVDRILEDFAAHPGEGLAGGLDAATEAHHRLQQRLTHPEGGSPAGG